MPQVGSTSAAVCGVNNAVCCYSAGIAGWLIPYRHYRGSTVVYTWYQIHPGTGVPGYPQANIPDVLPTYVRATPQYYTAWDGFQSRLSPKPGGGGGGGGRGGAGRVVAHTTKTAASAVSRRGLSKRASLGVCTLPAVEPSN